MEDRVPWRGVIEAWPRRFPAAPGYSACHSWQADEWIPRLVAEAGEGERVVDRSAAWGAMASTYLPEIGAALDAGERPVLVELGDDLPATVDRTRLVEIDHHGAPAGRDRPSSLQQVFDLLTSNGAAVV